MFSPMKCGIWDKGSIPFKNDQLSEHFIFMHIRSGSCQLAFKEQKMILQENNSLIISPAESIIFASLDSVQQSSVYWYTFQGHIVDSLLLAAGINTKNTSLVYSKHRFVLRWFKQLFECNDHQSLATEAIELSLLYRLFAHFITMREKHNDKDLTDELTVFEDGKLRPIQHALSYIHQHYAQKSLTVAELAAHVGLERSYFTKVFRSTLHRPPGQYLQDYRIEQATMLVCNSSMPIKNIAVTSGFSDPEYFTQVFKKKKGLSPLQLRKSQ